MKNGRFGHHKGSYRAICKYCAKRYHAATTETMKQHWLQMFRILHYVMGVHFDTIEDKSSGDATENQGNRGKSEIQIPAHAQ